MPKFVHDCDLCVLIGEDDKYDYYHCPNSEPFEGGTLIARYGSDGPKYCSCMVSLLKRDVERIRVQSKGEYPLVKAWDVFCKNIND